MHARLGAEGIVSKRIDSAYLLARAASGSKSAVSQHRSAERAPREVE
jgi:hypothetical protein